MAPSLKAMAVEAQRSLSTKAAAPKKAAKPEPAAATFKSAENVDESDESSSAASGSDSDSDDLPDTGAVTFHKANGAKLALSDSESASDSSDNEVGGSKATAAKTSTRSVLGCIRTGYQLIICSKTTVSSQADTVKSVPAAVISFAAPAGFEHTAKIPSNMAAQVFDKAKLEGKQIWYFTAPASVPISTVKKVSLQKAKEGKPTISHNGNDYGFVREEPNSKSYARVMVPSPTGNGYITGMAIRRIIPLRGSNSSSGSEKIHQTLHLQQMVNLQGLSDKDASRKTVAAKKPIRQQPQGLKMRFKPIGFGAGKAGKIGSDVSSTSNESDSDGEMERPQAQFRRPMGFEATNAASETSSSSSSHSDSDVDMADAPATTNAPALANQQRAKSGGSTSSIDSESEASGQVGLPKEAAMVSAKAGTSSKKRKHNISKVPRTSSTSGSKSLINNDRKQLRNQQNR